MKFAYKFLFIIILFSIGCINMRSLSNDVFLYDVIKVNFNLGKYILMSGSIGEVGHPLEAFLNLYAVKEGEVIKQIFSINDLYGIVPQIKNEEEALALLLFFIKPETSYFFNKDISDNYIVLRKVADHAKQGIGTIYSSKFDELKLKETTVERQDDNFMIELNLVRSNSISSTREIIRSIEIITSKGKHRIIKRETIAYLEAEEILMPYFE